VEFSEKGWVGIFLVKDDEKKGIDEIDYGT
jgi:hypothetical protein